QREGRPGCDLEPATFNERRQPRYCFAPHCPPHLGGCKSAGRGPDASRLPTDDEGDREEGALRRGVGPGQQQRRGPVCRLPCPVRLHHRMVLRYVRDDTMLSILADLAGPRLRELKPYEVTNLVWAFAKLAVPCSQLFWNAAQMLQGRRRGEYKAQCLAAAAWSFAKSSAVSRSMQQQLFKSMGDEILPQVGSLKPQEVANTVWSFGHIKLKHQRLFEEVAALLMTPSGVSRFSIAQLTSILTGFAQVKFYNAEAISKIAGVMLRNSNSLTPEQSSSVLWALAELDVRDRSLLVQKLLDMAAADINSFKPQELSVLNIAAKKLCPHHGSFFDACKATQMQGRNGLPGTESTGQ
ncbi:unnamed protein product, partial [Effrenium voratum]